MTEASGGRRAELERRLIERSLEDGVFRQRLLDDPRAAVEEREEVRIVSVEKTPDTVYLVLSSAAEGAE